ncbi:hypothetical protein PVAP13_6KG230006 [Panicum virgatum]|uniref:Uncharacterized protein n=1 Tax=Panicum virgatum TaxID=38727 RepID=A0A8T0RFQ4_PANVG|nr:hypothetical protein PVAP13_6KG230006 [Panicum virgatum]
MHVATLWPHDETAHQCPAAFGAAPHCGTMMLCRPRRLCRLVARVATTPLLATALALFLHQYPVTLLSATASSWSIKGRIRVAPPSLPTHFQPTRHLPKPGSLTLSVPLEQDFARCSLSDHPLGENLPSLSCSCRREFANNDEKKPGVRCRGIGSLYRKQKPGVRTASTRTSTESRKSKRVPRVEIPVC